MKVIVTRIETGDNVTFFPSSQQAQSANEANMYQRAKKRYEHKYSKEDHRNHPNDEVDGIMEIEVWDAKDYLNFHLEFGEEEQEYEIIRTQYCLENGINYSKHIEMSERVK